MLVVSSLTYTLPKNSAKTFAAQHDCFSLSHQIFDMIFNFLLTSNVTIKATWFSHIVTNKLTIVVQPCLTHHILSFVSADLVTIIINRKICGFKSFECTLFYPYCCLDVLGPPWDFILLNFRNKPFLSFKYYICSMCSSSSLSNQDQSNCWKYTLNAS